MEEKIEFWLKPAQPFDWYSDSRIYPFPKVTSGNMEIVPVKNSNRTITFTIIGLSNVQFETNGPRSSLLPERTLCDYLFVVGYDFPLPQW